MKRMLVNATQPEEIRVAIVDGQKLLDLDIESRDREQRKGNIYTGKITRIEPSLEAAFVDYGAERHGFLPLKEIAKSYFSKNPNDLTKGENGQRQRLNIKDVLKEGQEIIVQVEKEERGNKGAALTTFISLAGRFLVLMPTNPRAGGVSRRIEGEDRSEVREALSELTMPDDMGVIVRTAGVGRSAEELQWDLDYLLNLWSKLATAAEARPVPCLIYQESNIIVRALRDYFRGDIGEVQIDDPSVLSVAQEFMQHVMPHAVNKLKHYQDKVPLFNRYQIESQIESAFAREVTLPSGGSIVIDHTEALTSVDINSARATKGGDIEETAFNTNLEAAEEIARQLKIRDLGGLVVIDFIDMNSNRNQREVENRLKDSVKSDRARVQIGRISRFGLLEMSRQRLRPSLGDSANEICPRCSGHGYIRSTESFTLSMLRLISEEALKDYTGRVIARLPVAVATYLLNEKRDDFLAVEERTGVQILIIPSPGLKVPEHEIERIRITDIPPEQHDKASHLLARKMDENDTGESMLIESKQAENSRDEPAVKAIAPSTPAPEHKPRQRKPQQKPVAAKTGMMAALVLWFKRLLGAEKPQPKRGKNANQKGGNQRNNNRGKSNSNNRNNQRNQNNKQNNQRGNNNRNRNDDRQGNNQGSNKNNRNRNNNSNRNNNRNQANDNAEQGERKQSNGNNRNRQGNRNSNRQKTNEANDNNQQAKQDNRGSESKQPQERNEGNSDGNRNRRRRGSRGGRGRNNQAATENGADNGTANNEGGAKGNTADTQTNTPSSASTKPQNVQTANKSASKPQQKFLEKATEKTTEKAAKPSTDKAGQQPQAPTKPSASAPDNGKSSEKPVERKSTESKPAERKSEPKVEKSAASAESTPGYFPASKPATHLTEAAPKPAAEKPQPAKAAEKPNDAGKTKDEIKVVID